MCECETTKYPIVLVHGIAVKDCMFFRAFGRIEKSLRALGYRVYTADTDGFGTIEHNAVMLKQYISKILIEENADKVNLIAHSKGGLDCAYLINELGGGTCVASLTALCSPFRGSVVATKILSVPKPLLSIVAFFVNAFYKICGDRHPDALAVCNQLAYRPTTEEPHLTCPDVYLQSYSATLQKKRHDFVMGIPLAFTRLCGDMRDNDGLVSADSAAIGDYKGAIDGSVSHSQMIGMSLKKRDREKIAAFYADIARGLADMGF